MTHLILAINWACLWPLLLVAILPFVLGYLFRHLSEGDSDREQQLKDENKRLRDELTKLEKEDAALKYKLEESEKGVQKWKNKAQETESELAGLRQRIAGMSSAEHRELAERHLLATGNLEAHTEAELKVLRPQEYSAILSPDNLQVIEGIGPRIESMLKDKGIPNWARLSQTSIGELKAHLGAEKLDLHDPTTWPDQAALAGDAKWNELASLQRTLSGGNLTGGDGDTPAKVDRVAFGQSQNDLTSYGSKNLDYGSLFDNNDFQIIEGIGPRVNRLLNENGINSWGKLAEMNLMELRSLLVEKKLKMLNPDTWPQQAGLANAGKWAELVALQKQLDGGKSGDDNSESPSKVETLALKRLGFSQDPEDLKIVEGIGPKIEGLLKAAGINTWSDLSEAPLEQLQRILAEAGPRYRLAKADTWPSQAKMATEGDWQELKAYQDQLQGGRE